VHISEEASNANRVVPFTIITAPLLGCILGWVVNIVFTFFMGTDLNNIISNPIGQPFATILFNSFGKKGSLAIWVFIILSQFMIGACVFIASSRQTFAFARDGALPLSKYIYRINSRTQTPVNGVIFAGIVAWLLGLITLAGPAATVAIFSLAVCGQYVAYLIPISARFLGQNTFKPGPFSLGKLSAPISLIAVLWMCFATIILSFPSTNTVTESTMNYVCVVLGGWIILCIVGYYASGANKWFTGPRSNLDRDEPERAASLESSEKIPL